MHRIVVPLMGIFLAGCASIDTTRQAATDHDASQTFAASLPRVVRATRDSLPLLGLHIRQDEQMNDATHLLIAERSAHGGGFGELLRVTLHDTGRGVEARVFTEPRFLTDFYAEWDLSPDLFSQIDEELRHGSTSASGILAAAYSVDP